MSIPERKKLTREQKIDFWAAYMKAVLNPWSDKAVEQHEAGDSRLLEGIKRRGMHDTCEQFGIPWEQGVQVLAEILDFTDVKDDV